MAMSDPTDNFQIVQKRVIELSIQLAVLFILLLWCFKLIEPFVLILAWGAIVAVALYPVFMKLTDATGGRKKLAATILTLILIGILVVPTIVLTDSLLAGAQTLADAGELKIAPPPESIQNWPLIGERVFNYWLQASQDLPKLLKDFAPQLKSIGVWLLDTVAGTGLGILQFVVSFVIAGILLTTAEKGMNTTQALAIRLVGKRGSEFSTLTSGTVRNVAVGIVGVSILQTALLSLGFLLIGLPAAGLAALVALVLCIIQVGPGLVSLLAIIYAFSTMDTLPAVIFTVWTVVMTMIDSVLKPLVFGRGAAVPTLVIFLGAIGGMLAYGIIGLFVGAVVLSLGYKLYEAWLNETPMA